MKLFKKSIAVITGAGSGIGKQIAIRLWREGATVCLVGRDRARLESVLPSHGGGADRVRFHPADITRDDDVRDLAERLQADHDRVDILVHSAGMFAYGRWESFPPKELDRLYKTNLRAPVLLTQALLPVLRTSKGQIVFINSSAGHTSRGKIGAYSAMKYALRSFADSLREEVNPEGIRVISIYPGRTATPMQNMICKLEGKEYPAGQLLQPEEVAESVLCTLRMPRNAEVTDLHIRPMNKPQ